MWYTYMLLCDGKFYYVGITNRIKSRLAQHKAGQSFHTKRYTNLELVYCEIYESKSKAAKRERQLKGWRRAKKQKLVNRELGINTIELDEVL